MTGLPQPSGAGRRGNGLTAGGWTAVASLAPAVGDAVLAALARRGVAALVESSDGAGPAAPGPGEQVGDAERAAGPGTPRPEPGLDLLWVDARRERDARDVLTAEFGQSTVLLALGGQDDRDDATASPGAPGAPEPGAPEREAGRRGAGQAGAGRPGRAPLDEDAAWAEIVAGWHNDRPARRPVGGVAPWPVSEDLDETAPGGARPPAAPREPRPGAEAATTPDERTGTAPAAGPRDHTPASDPADEHYVPPPPPPLPRLRRGTVGALAGLALGVLLLFAPGLVGLGGGDGVAVTGIACIVGAVGALVYGMRDGRGRSGDDGAVV